MSINSLTNDELRRNQAFRESVAPRRSVRRGIEGGDVPAPPAETMPPGAAVEVAIHESRTNDSLSQLTNYLPVETLTLYVAAVSAAPGLSSVFPFMSASFLYWAFAVLTPIFVLLALAVKRREANMSPFSPLGQFPWWKMFAATVAFLAWALAIPNNPYISGEAGGTVAAFLALFISTILNRLERVFQPPVTTG
jgi:hypothetical protein